MALAEDMSDYCCVLYKVRMRSEFMTNSAGRPQIVLQYVGMCMVAFRVFLAVCHTNTHMKTTTVILEYGTRIRIPRLSRIRIYSRLVYAPLEERSR